jgi:ATP-binding cassette, subfamily B, bacterial
MPPLLVAWMIDIVSGNTPAWIDKGMGIADAWQGAIFIGALIFVIFGFESFFEWLYQRGFGLLAQDVQHQLRQDTYDKLQQQDLRFFENNRTGNLLSILNDDINQLERYLTDIFNELLQLVVLIIFSGIAFWLLSWQLALISMMTIPLVVAGSLYYQKLIAPYYRSIRQSVGEMNNRLENNIGGIQVVKSFTAEPFELDRVSEVSDQYRQSSYKALRISTLYVPFIRMFIAVGFAGVLLVAAWWIIEEKGNITLGQLALVGMLIQRLLWPLTRLGNVFDGLQRTNASARRIFGIHDNIPAIQTGENAVKMRRLEKGIRMEDIHFSYQAGDRQVLGNINLFIPAGKTVGIAGPTGAGKTSLIKLLLRFYDPDSGSVSFDGIDIRLMSISQLRRLIGVVSQEVYIFHGTIRENIAYGMPEATADDIISASRKAALHEFIISLPKGYDTLVGERGIKLSGGQRQRLSIARAILKDAPVIILDEATSAVDTETERIIQENLKLLTTGKTAIVIAHRLSTIRQCDTIIVLDEGRMLESGTHEALLEAKGLYAKLWRTQTGEM